MLRSKAKIKYSFLKYLETLAEVLLMIFPLAMFFSFHPVISLGENGLMNFELSIAEIWLVLFFLANLPQVKKLANFYGAKKLCVAAILPVYFTLSAIWSENHLRAILTAGIFWLLIFTALNLIYRLKSEKSLQIKLQRSLLISAAFISVFCFVQCVLDLAGFSQDYTLLCDGCIYTSFGFPHPNGFAIEPQFMGNLLLAPALLCFYLLSAPVKNKSAIVFQKKTIIALLLLITAILFLTLSRGAIYAFIVALAFQQIFLAAKNKTVKSLLKSVALGIATLLLALGLQGTFAATSKTSDTFISGVAKSVHQLTLGKIDFRPAETATIEAANTEPTASESAITGPQAAPATETSHFSGYVAESTDIRLNLNKLAVDTWVENPKYLAIGIGLGSAGIAMNRHAPDQLGPKEIVQNEYFSLLLETGLIGCVAILAIIIYTIKFAKETFKSPLFLSAILGFLITLFFFSGLPNVLHLYLFPLLFINTAAVSAVARTGNARRAADIATARRSAKH